MYYSKSIDCKAYGNEQSGRNWTGSNLVTNVAPATERFTGKELDKDGADVALGIKGMGLNYFGKRYYDPEIALWTSVDPMGQYHSPFTYCNNNPVAIIDPDGNEGFFVFNQMLGLNGFNVQQVDQSSQSVINAYNTTIDAMDNTGLALTGGGIVKRSPLLLSVGGALQLPAKWRDVKSFTGSILNGTATRTDNALKGLSLWTTLVGEGIGAFGGKAGEMFSKVWGFTTDLIFKASESQIQTQPETIDR